MIFGTKAPQMKDGSGNLIKLNFVQILQDEPDYRVQENEAEIDKSRDFYGYGYHWVFSFNMNLYKYWERYGIPVKTKYDQLYSYLFQEVSLWRHSDGLPIKDSNDADVPFFIEQVTSFYLNRTDFKDGLYMLFKSTKLISINKSSEEGQLTDDTFQTITDDSDSVLGLQ